MIRPPTIRVETPQEVCQTYSRSAPCSWYVVLNALAKFWPSSWLVPICSALPSPIIASRVRVLMAPAKRSLAVLRPSTTSMPSTLVMKSP